MQKLDRISNNQTYNQALDQRTGRDANNKSLDDEKYSDADTYLINIYRKSLMIGHERNTLVKFVMNF